MQGGCTVAWVGQKVIVRVTIYDMILDLRPNGAGGRHLRRDLWARFGKICLQGRINEPYLEGIVELKFIRRYKLQRVA